MKNLKKQLSILTFAFVMVISLSVINVNAKDYNFEEIQSDFLSGTEYTLTAEDNLIF